MNLLEKWQNRTPDEQIIMQSASQQNLPVKGRELINQIKLSCKSGKFALMRSGETIFWYHIQSPEQIMVTIFNADPLPKLVQNLDEFSRALLVAKYDIWTTQTQDSMVVTAVKKLESSGVVAMAQPGPIGQDGKQVFVCVVSVMSFHQDYSAGGKR
jgi:hypothetical protein